MFETILYYLNPLTWVSVHTICILVLLVLLFVLYVKHKWQVLQKYGIPGPEPKFYRFGHVPDAFDKKFFISDVKRIKKYGPIIGRYFGLAPHIMISDPDILKQVMIKDFKTFPDRDDRLNKVWGKEFNSALTQTTSDSWKRQRSTLTPTFSSSRMKEMFPILRECVESGVRNLYKKVDVNGGIVNAKDEFGNISMNSIISCAFGANLEEKQAEIAAKMKTLIGSDPSTNPFFIIAYLIKGFEYFLDWLDYSCFPSKELRYFKNLTDAVIDTKKSHGGHRIDLLQLMINAEKSPDEIKSDPSRGLTNIEIKGQVILFFIAGYETSTNTMHFLANQLATHPDLQEKLRQEIFDVLEKHDGEITYETISDMKYLEMCINETLRMYPIVPENTRICQKEININGITIPKGATIDIPVYHLHRSEEHWENPDDFIPERMRDMSRINPLVYQPFGAGPRNCIGMRFAMLEMKIVFVRLLQEFRFVATEQTPSYPIDLEFSGLVLKACEEVFFKIEPLN